MSFPDNEVDLGVARQGAARARDGLDPAGPQFVASEAQGGLVGAVGGRGTGQGHRAGSTGPSAAVFQFSSSAVWRLAFTGAGAARLEN